MNEKNRISPNLVIADVCDVTLESLATGKVIMTAEAQTTSISQTIDEQEIRGGRGGSLIATIQSQKTIEAQLTNALFSLDFIELVQGSDIEDAEKEEGVEPTRIWVKAQATATEDAGDIKLAVEQPADADAIETALIVGEDGLQYRVGVDATGELETDTATLFPTEAPKEGDKVEVLVERAVYGQMVAIRADRFPKKYKMTYRTVAFDPRTMEHVHDVIIQFDEVQPSADFDLGFEMSSPMAPEISFTVTKPEGCNTLGRFMLVDPIKDDELDC